ncbi:MAG: SH3 domain protein [Paraglaciecola sp.]|jgi:SH3 domain protein
MTRKQIISIFTLFLLMAFSRVANSQETTNSDGELRYISDDLFTFLHTGPGRNYRILGQVVAGTRVTLLQEDKKNNFVEIIDDKQRQGWVDGQFISPQQSLREVLPGLQQQLQEASQTVVQQRNAIGLLDQKITELSTQNKNLVLKQNKLQIENAKINTQLVNHDQTAKMQWFTRGGIIAVVSLLLGIILTYLPKKRSRNDNWM